MNRRAWLALPAAGLLVQLGLLTGALSFAPGAWRVALAFAVVVLLPGAVLLPFGFVPPGGMWLAPMWAAGFGVAWNALLVLVLHVAGAPVVALAGWSALTTAALWLAALALGGGRRANGRGTPPALTAGLPAEQAAGPAALPPAAGGASSLAGSPRALGLVLAAALLAAVHVGLLGTPITYYGDSPDHIGTVRRMMTGGEAFPNDAFFRDAGADGVDPRKALWHPQVAVIATLARVEAFEAWTWASAAIAPLFVLNAASFGWLAAGARGAAATALAALILGAGAIGWAPLRKAVFSTFLADQLCFAAAIAWLADLVSRSARSRAAAALLAVAGVFTHLYSALQLALTAGAYLAGVLLRDRARAESLRRLAVTAAVMAAACLPFALWRAQQAGAPANVIHTETQGMLWLAEGVPIISPGVLWDWARRMWVLFPLAWWPLWRHGRRNPAALYLLTTSAGVYAVLFFPPLVAWLEPKVGYLLMRTVWMVPFSGLAGIAAVALAARLRGTAGEGWSRSRVAALAGALALLFGLLPFASDAALTFVRPARFVGEERAVNPLAWREELRWMEDHLEPGRVVLTDPATSYGVPMLTGHFVVSLVDQHSSPRDPHALARLIDSRDALDPYATWERTREVVRRYGVDVIVLNGRFESAPRFRYWAPSREWFAAARARLERHPGAFERVYDAGDFAVYRLRKAALDTLDEAPPPRPYVARFEPGRFTIARRTGEEAPAFHRLALAPRVAAPGDTLRAMIEWRALAPLPPGSYQVAVRFDRALPGGFAPPAALAKPARKVLERARRELYRFRADHLPVGGEYGVDLWRPDEVVRDSFTVRIPAAAAEGEYAVEVRMYRSPHYTNLRLSDYFFDRDYFSGLPAGTIRVDRGRK